MSAVLFTNPAEQIHTMENRLQHELHTEVASEILAYVEVKSQKKYELIVDILIRRIHDINAIYETETETKEQYFERMQKFLMLTNPADLAAELKKTFIFNEIESSYKEILHAFSETGYGKFFLRYQFDEKAFSLLKQGILSHIEEVNKSLTDYSSVVSEHIQLLRSIKANQGFKTAFRIGTKLAGAALLGPLGSIGGGLLAKAVTNDEDAINRSYGRVLAQWDQHVEVLDKFLLDLRTNFKHILLTMVGGLFIRVNQDLKSLHVAITDLSLEEFGIVYSFSDEKQQYFKKWMQKQTAGIEELLKNGKYSEAVKVSNKLYDYINHLDLLKFNLYKDGKSYIYTAYLYNFSTTSTIIWGNKDNKEEFLSAINQLFESHSILLQEKDLKELGVPTQFDLACQCIKYWSEKEGLNKQIRIFPDFLLRIIRRYEQTGYYLGEQQDGDFFFDLVVSIGKMLYLNKTQKQYEFLLRNVGIPVNRLKPLIQAYQNLTGNEKDELVDFMNGMIFSARFWVVIKPLSRIMFFVLLIAVSIWGINSVVFPAVQNLMDGSEREVIQSEKNQRYLTVESEDGANIRTQPSLQAKIIVAVPLRTKYQIIDEKEDSDNRIWYKVSFREGETGWISGKIVSVSNK